MASISRRNPVIRISIPTQVSYALGLAFQQSMINTLRRNNETLSEDEQTKKIMATLNIKEVSISKSDSDIDEMNSLTYAIHIRQRVNTSKCPASSSESGSQSGDDDDDDQSVSSAEETRTQ